MMQLEMEISETRALEEAKVFESAAATRPLWASWRSDGTDSVMKNLANIEEVGSWNRGGFVATVYGVAIRTSSAARAQ